MIFVLLLELNGGMIVEIGLQYKNKRGVMSVARP